MNTFCLCPQDLPSFSMNYFRAKLHRELEVTMNDTLKKLSNTDIAGAPGLLTDDQGKQSMMRMMSLLALVASIWFAWMTLTNVNNRAMKEFT